MSGMKSAAPRGAIAESRLQDPLGPYHDTGSNASAAPKRSSSSVIMECPIKTDARTPPWQQRRCRHISPWRPKLPRYNPAPTTLTLVGR
eukprot:scaffold24674_cov26-Phaeocystis_antarctica.AAC.1